ncbi:uncharacterized protein LOC115073103 [Rhinatrema bivittatum]|uniref:uncharacterized protein LOC115073103 n=1 Tax=Rhinatrema bivittatum TaxID=194408 RepID=UPI0011268A4E|nr:uncharacterized protein LOC115073103 [Rhinatrema bivittatum]
MDLNTIFCLMCILQVAGSRHLYSGKGAAIGFSESRGETGEESLSRMDLRAEDTEGSPHRLRQRVWIEGHEVLGYQRSQCIHMSQPWVWGHLGLLGQQMSSSFKLRLHTAPSGPTRPAFPQQHLFQYIRTIYSCCKLGFACRKVKGLQGKIEVDDEGTNLEFYIDSDILGLSILRAELHLEISNPDHITVTPVLSTSATRSTSHLKLARADVSDLTLDATFLFHLLQEAGGTRREMSLSLNCIVSQHPVPCDHHGVGLLGAPFIAILYK